jgi:hypothetical protein
MTNEIKNKKSFTKRSSLIHFDESEQEFDLKQFLLQNINSVENRAKELREVWMRNS